MSLCIAMVIPEGIVIAGESRQTQRIAGVTRIASDNANKVFEVGAHAIAATAGWAFLQPQGSPSLKNIASIIEDFRATIPDGSTVKQIATLLWEYFNTVFQQHLVNIPGDAIGPNMLAINFMIGGYDSPTSEGELYTVSIPSTTPPSKPVRSTNTSGGPWWIGQTDVVARILKGYDTKAHEISFFRTGMENPDGKSQIGALEYSIFSNLMTLQDAIDFAVEMIRVTIAVQRFTAGTMSDINNNHGSFAGVGGPIDIAVVRPRQDNLWVARKTLHP